MRQVPEEQAFDVRSLSRLTTWRKKEQNEIRLQPSRLTSPSVGFLRHNDPRKRPRLDLGCPRGSGRRMMNHGDLLWIQNNGFPVNGLTLKKRVDLDKVAR